MRPAVSATNRTVGMQATCKRASRVNKALPAPRQAAHEEHVPPWPSGVGLRRSAESGTFGFQLKNALSRRYRDLAGWADLTETLSDLSAFADAAIDAAVRHARRGLVARYGEPRSAAGVVLRCRFKGSYFDMAEE